MAGLQLHPAGDFHERCSDEALLRGQLRGSDDAAQDFPTNRLILEIAMHGAGDCRPL